MSGGPRRHRSARSGIHVLVGLVGAAVVVVLVAACGGTSADDLTGAWYRVDDHGFVLTITEAAGGGYEVRFESTTTGDSQSIAGIPRSGGTLQAALMIPQEPMGALTAGAPEVVPVTLSPAGDELVVTMDAAGGASPVELWRYERSGE